MRGDEAARGNDARQIQGDNLARAFPPDRAADADMERLISQLDAVWLPPVNRKETKQ